MRVPRSRPIIIVVSYRVSQLICDLLCEVGFQVLRVPPSNPFVTARVVHFADDLGIIFEDDTMSTD